MPRKSNSFTLFGKPIYHPLNLIILFNVLAFIIIMNLDFKMIYLFALTPILFFEGYYWQIFSYGFLHSPNFILHIFFNLYASFILWEVMEVFVDKFKLTALYFVSQLGGGVAIVIWSVFAMNFSDPEYAAQVLKSPTLGASGAVFGLMTVFGLLFPERILLLFFVIPISAKNLAPLSLIVGFIFEIYGYKEISNMGHLGGAIFGFLFFKIFMEKNLKENFLRTVADKVKETEIKIFKKESETKQETSTIFETNQRLKEKVLPLDNLAKKETILIPLLVENANICSPPTFNTEDNYCMNCEWFANCLLRKSKEK
jgi:membrane associated rhomboid family serine protease